MKKRLSILKNLLASKSLKGKNLILSLVALFEIIAIMIVATSAWVETISSIQITATGNIDTRTYTNADITGSGNIDLSSYFKAAGDMHLSSASSADGGNFYFPVVSKSTSGTTASTFRAGTINDKNVNYISFQLKVKASSATTQFYFSGVPTIKVDGEEITGNDIRVAITDSNTTTIYSNTNKTESVVSSESGTETSTTVNAFSSYIFKDDGSVTPVISVNKGETDVITVTLWLQDAERTSEYAGKTVTVEDFELSQGIVMTDISFVDDTSYNGGTTGWHYVANDSARLFAYDADSGKSYELTKDSSYTSTYLWTGKIPIGWLEDTTKTIYFCRCASSENSVTSLDDSNVWEYWAAKASDAASYDSKTYTAYGSTDSSTSKVRFGTWGSVIRLQLDTENTSILPVPSAANSATKITITNSSDSSVTSVMTYVDDLWQAYIPAKDSSSFKFSFTYGSSRIITAASRDTTETVSKFVVTSASTGYWDPPATVKVVSNSSTYGSVSAKVDSNYSGTSVKVTAGTSVTLTATANSGYDFVGWYSDSSYSTQKSTSASYTVTAPAKDTTVTYYAKFQIQTFAVKAYAYTDGSNSSTGGTVKVTNGSTGATSSATVNYNTSVTYTATVNSGYDFEGWYTAATGGTLVSSSASYTKTITSSTNITLYARFTTSAQTVYVGIAYYLIDNNTISASSLQIHWWNSSTSGDVSLVSMGTSKYYSPGSSYWSGTKQKFYMYKVELPAEATGMKLRNGNTWYGGDTTISSYNTLMLFEYGNTYYSNETNYSSLSDSQ